MASARSFSRVRMLCTFTRLRSPGAGSSFDASPFRVTQPGTRPKRTMRGPAMMSVTSTRTPWSARVVSTSPAHLIQGVRGSVMLVRWGQEVDGRQAPAGALGSGGRAVCGCGRHRLPRLFGLVRAVGLVLRFCPQFAQPGRNNCAGVLTYCGSCRFRLAAPIGPAALCPGPDLPHLPVDGVGEAHKPGGDMGQRDMQSRGAQPSSHASKSGPTERG